MTGSVPHRTLWKPALHEVLSLIPARLPPRDRGMAPASGVVLHGGTNLVSGRRLEPQGPAATLEPCELGLGIRSGSTYWSQAADEHTDAPVSALTLAAVFCVNSWAGSGAAIVGRPIDTAQPYYAYGIHRDGSTSAVKPYLGFTGGSWIGTSGISISPGAFYTAVLRWSDGDLLRFAIYETRTGRLLDARQVGPKYGTLGYAGSISEFRIGRNQASANVDTCVAALVVSPRQWTDAEVSAFVGHPYLFMPSRESLPSLRAIGLPGVTGTASTPALAWQGIPATAAANGIATKAGLSLEPLHRLSLEIHPLHRVTLSLTEAGA